jgi:Flp pilus assembly CpaE family ATPase
MSDAYENYEMRVNRQDELDRSEGSTYLNSYTATSVNRREPNGVGADLLSIGLIGPDEDRRRSLAATLGEYRGSEVREFTSYPPSLEDVPRLLDGYYDVIIIDIDSDLEYALELVEAISAKDLSTVMVYSARADQELVFRCMRAGAREFLFPPFDQNTIVDALVRATIVVRPAARQAKKARGRLDVFLGAKGGSGVTTIACNFAIAVGQESGQNTLLVDLGLPMGDAALNLGIVSEFSTENALQDVDRLDSTFLTKLLVKHRSGISVLAAPSKVPKVQASSEAIDKLMKAARREFDNVIVDVGSRLDLMDTSLFKEASTIYLVTQAGISELRNSNRVISEFFAQGSPKLEVVINRYDPRSLGLTDEHITKALNRPVQWKIPDDYAAARQMQNSTSPSSQADSPIARLIRQMARASCGLPAIPEKTTGFRLRGLGKNIAEKISTSEEQAAVSDEPASIVWSAPAPIIYGTRLNTSQLDASASVPGTFAYAPAAGYLLPAGTHTLWVTFNPLDPAAGAPVQSSVSITVAKATPTIIWSAPHTLSCGTSLGDAQLNAAASVPGTLVYTPPAGEVLPAGKHKLSVTFTPKDSANYTTAEASVQVAVAKAAPTLSWPTPAPITCGSALSDTQLNATSPVPGSFVYSPAAGEVLTAGRHTLSVTFIPTDTTGYSEAQSTVVLTVTRATPTIEWRTTEPISYGTRLSSEQLAATASVAGTFTYIPDEGAMLAAGIHTPVVTFTPADLNSYTKAQAVVTLTVNKAEPAVTWETPASIADGTPLTTTQLNATASVPGTFIYEPAAGTILPAGSHSLTVTFTPIDSENYNPVQASISLTVTKAAPTMITWRKPSPISYGTELSDAQLNATASVAGSFVYSPATGDVLAVGMHKLAVSFTPADTARYAPSQTTVALEVEERKDVTSLPTADEHTPFMHADTVDEAHLDEANREEHSSSKTPSQNGEPETRTYKGAIYEKGEDGKWHLQRK